LVSEKGESIGKMTTGRQGRPISANCLRKRCSRRKKGHNREGGEEGPETTGGGGKGRSKDRIPGGKISRDVCEILSHPSDGKGTRKEAPEKKKNADKGY